ncbi:phospholipid phosphatase-related protein type 3 [Lampris incognitus]|uniref:phospholipid phosphatase-related protein type 3 n=1 Tax=Lampris incognitus TaxID=2546036 RepID=UPI0024B61FD8|nr:phospholipid phosphatase-related protein type 3 [Lampris incognitus]
MMTHKDQVKKKAPKDSLTLLPCFYFVEIMMGEGLLYCLQSPLRIRAASEGSISAGGCSFNSFLRRTVRFVGVHMFGLCATALVTDVIQLATGYHTPFFLTVCKPNYTLAGVSCEKNPYITKDICSGHDQHAILSARKSFPSQHATLSAFAAVYVSMYFNSTISDSTKLLKPLLVFAFSFAAVVTGLTQITQHRSHPTDVYVGFLIGGFIAAYLALHAVANFKSSDDFIPVAPPLPPKDDALRALTLRGHDSVYNKGPASASESNDEIAAAPAALGCPPQRDKTSMDSLKRASVEVELLAPHSPMGKETMVTFSNTLPRASINVNGILGNNGGADVPPPPVQSVQPVHRRLKAVQVPMDPMRSQQLVSEWKQKSMEMRAGGLRDEPEQEASEDGTEVSSVGTDEGSSQLSVFLPAVQPERAVSNAPGTTQQPGVTRVVMSPRPPQYPEAGPPPVSPKSALTRAKWLAITEKGGGGAAVRGATNQPRLMQVIAMSKQQGLLPSSSSGKMPKSSETTSTSSGISSTADSPHYHPPAQQQREGSGIVTVDAHAPHHPTVQAPLPPHAPPPSWEWNIGSHGNECQEPLNNLNRRSSFRPHHSASPCSSNTDSSPIPPLALPQGEHLLDGQRREMSTRRKTALVLLDREIPNQTEQENYFKKLQGGARFKE